MERKLNTNKTNVNDQITNKVQQALDNADSVRKYLENNKAKVAARVKRARREARRKGFVSPLRF